MEDLRDFADTLNMWSSMMLEHLRDSDSGLPIPSLMQNWLDDYRELYQRATEKADTPCPDCGVLETWRDPCGCETEGGAS